MSTRKTLYILEFQEGRHIMLRAFYALNLADARETIMTWANNREYTFIQEPHITPRPGGLMLNHRWLPGHIEVEEIDSEQKERPEAQ